MSIISALAQDKWRVVRATIPAGSSLEFDAVPLASYAPTKYYVEMKSNSENVFKSFEIFGARTGATNVSDTLYAKQGSQINTSAVIDVYSGTVKLILSNNETYPLTVRVTKLVN